MVLGIKCNGSKETGQILETITKGYEGFVQEQEQYSNPTKN